MVNIHRVIAHEVRRIHPVPEEERVQVFLAKHLDALGLTFAGAPAPHMGYCPLAEFPAEVPSVCLEILLHP